MHLLTARPDASRPATTNRANLLSEIGKCGLTSALHSITTQEAARAWGTVELQPHLLNCVAVTSTYVINTASMSIGAPTQSGDANLAPVHAPQPMASLHGGAKWYPHSSGTR